MKNLVRYVFAAALAVTVYSFSNGSEKAVVFDDPNDELTFVEGHELAGQTMLRYEIESSDNCPGEGQDCAKSEEANVSPIEWSGPTTKF